MAQQFDDGLALDVVVLDDQQPLGARGGEILEPVERRLQALGGRRLDEVRERAVGQDRLALFFHGDDLHRDVARRRVELELVEHRPAEHVGQEDIERDGLGTELPGEGKARRAPGGHDALEALVARQAQEDARVVRIVLDDQQYGVALLDALAVVGDVLFAGHRQDADRMGLRRIGRAAGDRRGARRVGARVMQRQVEGERAALAVDAGEPDFAAQQHGQLAADGEAEAGAAVLARGAGVGLLEGLEDEPLLLRRDADAGVLHGEGDHLLGLGQHRVIGAPARRGKADANLDVAMRRELDGVGQQVLEDLLQALRVAVQDRGQVGVETARGTAGSWPRPRAGSCGRWCRAGRRRRFPRSRR